MSTANDILLDGFGRVHEVVHETVADLGVEQLTYRPEAAANSIAWLVWHLTRIQDDHIADLAGTVQVWTGGWAKKLALPFDEAATGWGQSADEVGMVVAPADSLLGYFDAVHEATTRYIGSLKDEDYHRIVDRRFDPPVTLAVRLVSVLSDDLQHAGQAAYIRGLISE